MTRIPLHYTLKRLNKLIKAEEYSRLPSGNRGKCGRCPAAPPHGASMASREGHTSMGGGTSSPGRIGITQLTVYLLQ